MVWWSIIIFIVRSPFWNLPVLRLLTHFIFSSSKPSQLSEETSFQSIKVLLLRAFHVPCFGDDWWCSLYHFYWLCCASSFSRQDDRTSKFSRSFRFNKLIFLHSSRSKRKPLECGRKMDIINNEGKLRNLKKKFEKMLIICQDFVRFCGSRLNFPMDSFM